MRTKSTRKKNPPGPKKGTKSVSPNTVISVSIDKAALLRLDAKRLPLPRGKFIASLV